MSFLTLRRGALVAGMVVAGVVGAGSAAAQEKAAPPTFSRDLTVGWIGVGDFRPVPGHLPPVTSDPKYPYVPNGQGRQPTFRIADLTNPNLKPWVKEVMKKDNDEVLAGKVVFTPSSSCMPAGVPGFLALAGNNNPVWFLQTPKQVSIIRDADSQVRRVYLDVPHSPNPKPTWYGESVGHYEGDTLVVDTIGLSRKTFVDAYRTPHSEKLHVVERWKLGGDGKTLEVTMTVDDPETYKQPWQAVLRYRQAAGPLSEAACAENNLQFDYH